MLDRSVGKKKIRTFGAEDHVPGLAGRVVASDAFVEEAPAHVGLLGAVLVRHHPLVLLHGDLLGLCRRRLRRGGLRRLRRGHLRRAQGPTAGGIAETGRVGQEACGGDGRRARGHLGGGRGRWQRGGEGGHGVWTECGVGSGDGWIGLDCIAREGDD